MSSAAPSNPPKDFELDPTGLLAALALAPTTYSRNKYPRLYVSAEAKHTRRRARLLRGLARQLTAHPGGTIEADGDGFLVSIDIPELAYRRRSTLTQLERDLVVYLVARLAGGRADEELVRIEAALALLAVG